MTKVVMVIEGFAGGVPCAHAGQYLRCFDHDAKEGRGYGEFTTDKNQAMVFDDAKSALEFWRKQSSVKPLREDGKPNRPLTAATVSILPL